jgi:hypothetical protein
MLALKRYPWKLRRAKAREWGARGHEAQARMRMERGPDPETVRLRALHDARGEVLRHGVTYSTAHPKGRAWTILRSKAGRVNQVDLHVAGALFATCGLRTLERGMARAKL